MTDKACTLYIQPEETAPSSQEIEKQLKEGKLPEKLKALKSLIITIIHDEQFPRMIMTIMNFLVPINQDNKELKKLLLFYWEIIEKLDKNGKLKDEMILVCNSIRNDLLHPNEYLRGKTLRLVSRIMYKGILESISSAIVENLEHKHTYVRRNAVVALYQIFLNFGSDLIDDIDISMEKILQNETDISTKRNAFLLLFHANQAKALEFLNTQINNEQAEEMGDIMQLAVLELFRKTCKYDPSQKARLMKAIFYFSKSKSQSVLFECAHTLTQISNTPTTLKLATSIYLQLLSNPTDNNVKLVVLGKLYQILKINPKFLQDQVIDITKVLNNQSSDIRKQTLQILKKIINIGNIDIVFPVLIKEIKKIINDSEQKEYFQQLLELILHMVNSFEKIQEQVSQLVLDTFLTHPKLDDASSILVKDILTTLILKAGTKENFQQNVMIIKVIQKFFDIQNIHIYKSVLWLIGEFVPDNHIENALQSIIRSIGNLPIEEQKAVKKDEDQKAETVVIKKKVKTVILEDGTYGQQVVEEHENINNDNDSEQTSKFRECLISNSYITSSLSRTMLKLIFQLKSDKQLFNKYASKSLLIFCSLYRYFQKNISKVDQDSIESLNLCIKLLTNPQKFKRSSFKWMQNNSQYLKNSKNFIKLKKDSEDDIVQQDKKQHIAKQPDDVIVIRGLKGKSNLNEIDLSDEEINEFDEKVEKPDDFVQKLSKLIQLTGYSDPIYAEAFVDIHKFDISFDVFLINRSGKPLQNITVGFITQGEQRSVEKSQSITLKPDQSAQVKTSIKFSSQEIGIIFGSINYENMAGVEQDNLITKEIFIDLIDFIYPADIHINEFRASWAKYEWENRISINTNITNLLEYILHMEKQFRMRMVNGREELFKDSRYACVNFYAKTKLDDDFLINVSAEQIDDKIQGYARIRARNKGIVVNLGDKIKGNQNKIE